MGEEAQPESLLKKTKKQNGAGRSASCERILLSLGTLFGPGLRARRCARFLPVNALPNGARVRNKVDRGRERVETRTR